MIKAAFFRAVGTFKTLQTLTIRTIFYKKIGYLFVFLVKLDKAADLYASVQIFALPFDAFIIYIGQTTFRVQVMTE